MTIQPRGDTSRGASVVTRVLPGQRPAKPRGDGGDGVTLGLFRGDCLKKIQKEALSIYGESQADSDTERVTVTPVTPVTPRLTCGNEGDADVTPRSDRHPSTASLLGRTVTPATPSVCECCRGRSAPLPLNHCTPVRSLVAYTPSPGSQALFLPRVDRSSALGRLFESPDLICRGRHPFWDVDSDEGESAPDRDARLTAAATACGRCPAIELCRQAIDELPPRVRRGVWGGQVYGVGRPPGRPARPAAEKEIHDQP